MTNQILGLSIYLLTNGLGTLTWYEPNSTNIIGWNSTCSREAQITFNCTPSNRYQIVYAELIDESFITNASWTICSPPLYSLNTNSITFVTPIVTNEYILPEQMFFSVRQYNGSGGLFPTNQPTGCLLSSWPVYRLPTCFIWGTNNPGTNPPPMP